MNSAKWQSVLIPPYCKLCDNYLLRNKSFLHQTKSRFAMANLKLILTSLVLVCGVFTYLAQPALAEHDPTWSRTCNMSPFRCPFVPEPCPLNPGLSCPHPDFLEKHSDTEGRGSVAAIIFTIIRRWANLISFNTVFQGDTTYFLNGFGNCTNTDLIPAYRVSVPTLDRSDVVFLGRECRADHSPSSGHLYLNTLWCRSWIYKRPLTSGEQYEKFEEHRHPYPPNMLPEEPQNDVKP